MKKVQQVVARGLDVNQRTVTMHFYSLVLNRIYMTAKKNKYYVFFAIGVNMENT